MPAAFDPWRLFGALTAFALATIDVAFFRRGAIGPIYLMDAVIELALVVGWCATALTNLPGEDS